MIRHRFLNYFIAFVFLLTAVGRGWNLMQRGLLEHDEGHALLNANTWWHILRWLVSGGWRKGDDSLGQIRDALHQQGGTLYSAGKLGYSLIVAAVALPAQVSTHLALALGWAVGLMVAGLAGALAWQYSRSRAAAIIATGGCLASPLMITLSREASGTIWALALGLAGLWLMQRGVERSFDGRVAKRPWFLGVIGGAMLGYGFTCHFNLAPFILAVFVATGFYGMRVERARFVAVSQDHLDQRARGGWWGRFLWPILPGAAGALGMLLLFEAVTQVADYVLRNAYPEFLPLSGELHRLFFRDQVPMLDGVLYGDGAIGWKWDAWAIYGNAALREGPAWLLLLVGVLPAMAWSRGRRAVDLAPAAALLLIPLLFWAAYVYRVERVLGMCVTASWILLGMALGPVLEGTAEALRGARYWGTIRRWRGLAWGFAAAHLVAGGLALAALAAAESPIPTVIRHTFDAPEASGKLITASAFDGGFAPLWKWAMVEEARQRGEQTGLPRVDFSTFARPEIMFTDPFSWRRADSDFHITQEEAEAGKEITAKSSIVPPWHLQAILLAPVTPEAP